MWAAQAGARKVYAIEYTEMAKHAQKVMKANGVDHIVTVIQSAVEDVELPIEEDGLELEPSEEFTDTDSNSGNKNRRCVDIIVSEWMGYFLLRESMLDSIIRARDIFIKRQTGLMFPSHTTMYLAPVSDEESRKQNMNEYSSAMSDWHDFAQTTSTVYGVQMDVLEKDYEREQKEYHLLSSRWTELAPEAVLVDQPAMIKHLDMMTCTLEDSLGINKKTDPDAKFEFKVNGDKAYGPVSGVAGWFTADFKSRTDDVGVLHAPKLHHPAFLSTGPENGYTHWGQQTFYFANGIPLLHGEMTLLTGSIEMMRTKANSRLYNCRIRYTSSRRRIADGDDGPVLMKSAPIEQVYQIP